MTKKNLVLILFLVLKFALQYVLLSSEYDLQRDEYLHLDQAKHLAWGFQSVPPFTSWVSYIILLLGNTIFWIKFFPALFGALTLLIVWKANSSSFFQLVFLKNRGHLILRTSLDDKLCFD